MVITFDPAKRDWTLVFRGVDFADAEIVLSGVTYEFVDDRHDYGELRLCSVGMLNDRMMIVIWTRRGEHRHIISMRKANDREQGRYGCELDRSG